MVNFFITHSPQKTKRADNIRPCTEMLTFKIKEYFRRGDSRIARKKAPLTGALKINIRYIPLFSAS